MTAPRSWQPGFHGVAMSEPSLAALRRLADTLIPGDRHYPAASVAEVAEFISTHINAADLAVLENEFLGDRRASDGSETEQLISEGVGREAFNLLRSYVYLAYYSSSVVTEAMNRRGIDYHGAPQPAGYEIDLIPPQPTHDRGSYIATDTAERIPGGW